MASTNGLETLSPMNAAAEQAVLGGLLLGASFVDVAWLLPEDFFAGQHRSIWKAMAAVAERGYIDTVTVHDELQRQGTLETAGGATYLSGLSAVPVSVLHVMDYARILRRCAVERRMISASAQLSGLVYASADLTQIHALLTATTTLLAGDMPMAAPYRAVAEGLGDYLEQLASDDAAAAGLRTGIADLDYLTGGLQAGNLVMIGGVTTVGKSSLALQIATHVAATRPVLFVSLEMTCKELYERLIASYTGLPIPRLRRRDLTDDELAEVARALGWLHDLDLDIDDRSGLTLTDITSTARQWQRTHRGALIVLDYAQKIMAPGSESRTQEMGSVAKALKNLAKELHLPLLVPAQLTRGAMYRRPTLADMAESIDFAREADVVLLFYRPAQDRPGPPYPAELIVEKQRNGPQGVIKGLWLPERMLFGSVA